ncbi:MAG: hypothetical protein PHH68_02385 [Candidatus Omnitrophica bacterium]|nr:hypothetical protein [Candidatus Omnitrophota bacterium]MDD5079157.1 hypothetical protein [Candidatus Omnitrophota bacterium]
MTANLKEQLQALIQLQAIDTQIYRLNDEKKAKPLEIEALKNAFEAKKESLAKLEKVSLDLQKEKKERELELASKEENAKKLQAQLYQLKTNKEYNTMLQQIQDAKADGSVIEDKILESMDKIESSKADIDNERKKLQQEEQTFNAQKKIVEDRIKEIDEKLRQMEAQRNQNVPAIDTKILAQYERILKNREGLAIVSVKNNTCSGCNMFMPAQVINLIRMYEKIMVCDVCNRILFIGDE